MGKLNLRLNVEETYQNEIFREQGGSFFIEFIKY